jgi:hypothetical protein
MFLISSTMSISPLELSSRTLYWCLHHSYLQFQIACFTFLLVLFDSLVGKAFLARSIKLCLVDNQRSSGVMVVGFESYLIWSRIINVEISTNRTYQLPLGRSGLYSSIGIRYFRFTMRYILVCLIFIFVHYLESTQSPKIFQFPLSYHPLCLCNFVSDSRCWVCIRGRVLLLV